MAYTNNGRNGGITTLYTISSAQDALYIQNPPNGGTQTAPIALSQNLTAVHGFDLDSQAVTTTSNTAVTAGSSQAFAVVTTAGGATGLVRINLLTGAVSAVAPIANNTTNIRGFAVRDVRVPGSFPATALDASAPALIRFNTATPGTTTTSVAHRHRCRRSDGGHRHPAADRPVVRPGLQLRPQHRAALSHRAVDDAPHRPP